MKIVLCSYSSLPSIGGMEMVVHHLASSLLRIGHRVRVVTSGGFRSHRGLHCEYPVHRWPTLKGRLPEQERFTQLLLDTMLWGCDVIHAHDSYLMGYAATRLKRLRHVPLIVTPHGEDIHVIPEIGYGARLNPRLAARIAQTLDTADILTAVSASVETSLLEAGAHRDKIRRIPNGIDIARYHRNGSREILDRFRIPPDSRIILTVGNYYPPKGHEILVRSMPAILGRVARAHLVIVGRNNEILRPLIEDLRLEEKITLTGSIDFPPINSNGNGISSARNTDDLADLYCAADVYVSAGIGEGAEGLSLALLDGMAAGLPIVATDISGNRDIVREGESGFLVPPSDPRRLAEAVARLLDKPELGTSLGTTAREAVRQFEWTRIASMYQTVYEEAIESVKRARGSRYEDRTAYYRTR